MSEALDDSACASMIDCLIALCSRVIDEPIDRNVRTLSELDRRIYSKSAKEIMLKIRHDTLTKQDLSDSSITVVWMAITELLETSDLQLSTDDYDDYAQAIPSHMQRLLGALFCSCEFMVDKDEAAAALVGAALLAVFKGNEALVRGLVLNYRSLFSYSYMFIRRIGKFSKLSESAVQKLFAPQSQRSSLQVASSWTAPPTQSESAIITLVGSPSDPIQDPDSLDAMVHSAEPSPSNVPAIKRTFSIKSIESSKKRSSLVVRSGTDAVPTRSTASKVSFSNVPVAASDESPGVHSLMKTISNISLSNYSSRDDASFGKWDDDQVLQASTSYPSPDAYEDTFVEELEDVTFVDDFDDGTSDDARPAPEKYVASTAQRDPLKPPKPTNAPVGLLQPSPRVEEIAPLDASSSAASDPTSVAQAVGEVIQRQRSSSVPLEEAPLSRVESEVSDSTSAPAEELQQPGRSSSETSVSARADRYSSIRLSDPGEESSSRENDDAKPRLFVPSVSTSLVVVEPVAMHLHIPEATTPTPRAGDPQPTFSPELIAPRKSLKIRTEEDNPEELNNYMYPPRSDEFDQNNLISPLSYPSLRTRSPKRELTVQSSMSKIPRPGLSLKSLSDGSLLTSIAIDKSIVIQPRERSDFAVETSAVMEGFVEKKSISTGFWSKVLICLSARGTCSRLLARAEILCSTRVPRRAVPAQSLRQCSRVR